MNKKAAPKKPKKINSSIYSQPYLVPSLVLGIVILAAAMIVRVKVGQNEVRASLAEPQTILLDVPSRPISKGEQLKNVPLTKIKWPSSSDASRFLRDTTAYQNFYTTNNLPAFAPIPLDALVANSLDGNAVVENIPVGYRAITVKVDVESIVEGWAQTGNYVDVIVLRQSSEPEMGIEAKLIAENVKILSAGASAESSKSNSNSAHAPATVTLLVSQEDALKIRTASTVGKLTFALRGMGDQTPSTTISMNQKLLLGGARSANLNRSDKKAVAKGPDGKTYILDENGEWVIEIK